MADQPTAPECKLEWQQQDVLNQLGGFVVTVLVILTVVIVWKTINQKPSV